jgi:hypothetical protein
MTNLLKNCSDKLIRCLNRTLAVTTLSLSNIGKIWKNLLAANFKDIWKLFLPYGMARVRVPPGPSPAPRKIRAGDAKLISKGWVR